MSSFSAFNLDGAVSQWLWMWTFIGIPVGLASFPQRSCVDSALTKSAIHDLELSLHKGMLRWGRFPGRLSWIHFSWYNKFASRCSSTMSNALVLPNAANVKQASLRATVISTPGMKCGGS